MEPHSANAAALGFLQLILILILTQISGVLSLECYSCVYIAGVKDSRVSCSDPWPWYRDAFGDMAKPPTVHCPHACVKIVITKEGRSPTVVRECGWGCNETMTQTTTTSCCHEDFCNGGKSVLSNSGILSIIFSGLIILQKTVAHI